MNKYQLDQAERRLAVKFQDAIGEVVDEYLRDGIRIDLLQEVLRDEADGAQSRKRELELEGERP